MKDRAPTIYFKKNLGATALQADLLCKRENNKLWFLLDPHPMVIFNFALPPSYRGTLQEGVAPY
jgi:hypothetical protein